MGKRTQETQIFAVLQFGGTSDEHYLHSFSKRRDATAYIRKATCASYQCLGPFPILLNAEGELARVAKNTIEWLKKEGFESDQHTLELKHALAMVQEDLAIG